MHRCIFLIVISMLIYTSALADNKHATLSIYNDYFSKTYVHKEIFGGFLEYLNHYINGPKGIYAQEFLDRGMDWKNLSSNFSRKWTQIDVAEDVNYGITEGGYNRNGEFYTFIINKSQNFKGAAQEVCLNDSVSHEFYVYAKTPTHSNLTIRLLMDSNLVYSYNFGNVTTDWEKYKLEIPPINGIHKVSFQIGNNTEGELHIDEASLMPTNNIKGLRQEFYDMLKYWNPGMLRYPGGCFADSPGVLLESCIGDLDQRLAPLVVWPPVSQRMEWGADEFLRFCEELDIEPHITVNYVNGTAEEAAAWVEYCNSDTNTYWGNKRAENGHPAPYNVKYFEIGNEQWDNQEQYAEDYIKYYDLMKAVDSSIMILIDGNHWNGNADMDYLYTKVKDKNDIYGYHPALRGQIDIKDDDVLFKYLTGSSFIHEQNDISRMFNKLRELNLFPKIKLSASEWWLDYATWEDWTIDTNIRNASLESGLVNAGYINAFIRSAECISTAARTFGIGLNRCYIKEDGRRYFTTLPALEALSMLRNHTGDSLIISNTESEKFDLPDFWFWEVPFLDAHVTKTKDSVFVTMLNRYKYDTLIVNIDILPFADSAVGKHYLLWSENVLDAVDAETRFEMPYKTFDYVNNNQFKLLPHSLNIFAFGIESWYGIQNDKISHDLFKISNNVISQDIELRVCDDVELEFVVFDVVGNRVVSGEVLNSDVYYINMTNVSQGIYFLNLHVEDKVYTEKIIKVN